MDDDNKKTVNHLTIYLLKSDHAEAIKALRTEECEAPVTVLIAGHDSGLLFIRKMRPAPPRWAALFREYVDEKNLLVRSISAAFLIPVKGRAFVLVFGQGGRHLLRDDVFEGRFGLLCALNAVDPETFRCIDVQSLDAIDSQTRIQSGQETTSDQFGLSIEQDMLKAIVGKPKDIRLGSRMTGSDGLSVSVRMDLSDLPHLLDAYRQKFEEDLRAEAHQWVNNIAPVKSTAIVTALDALLDARLAADQLNNIWLSIPEVIDWTQVQGFIYTNGKGVMNPDINMSGFRKTVDTALSLDMMKARSVYCADENNQRTAKSWSVFKCLYAEIEHGGATYVLNDGKWFSVATDFVARTMTDYAAIPRSKLALPEYSGGGEGTYNKMVADAAPAIYDLLDDRKKVMHGGGHGQVEICDLFTRNRELVHVKMYGKSSVLSHLFAQGFVSGQLIQIDGSFRQKVRDQLSPSHQALIEASTRPAPDAFTIVYAVISDDPGASLHLPFFSKVNLNNTCKVLRGYGFKVELLKIPVNANFAKTTKIPAKRPRRTA